MPPYLVDAALWWSLVPIPALVAIVAGAALVWLRLRGTNTSAALTVVLPLAAFLLTGLVAGYLTGLSRESAVGAVVPAVLSLLGGAAAVLVGRAANLAAATRVSGLILLFSLGLFIGTTWGSAMRQAVADFDASELELIRRSHVELKVREFRESVGLPPEFPSIDAPPSKKKSDKDK